ncbi:hypothetical protein LCGC14_1558380 [marine sediment metagenome]|uniref:Uncharacterized protein n=1 Tax=marine sediment metagenome TaxID=412755 RepID=A0A0F9L4K7_9ZZZZ
MPRALITGILILLILLTGCTTLVYTHQGKVARIDRVEGSSRENIWLIGNSEPLRLHNKFPLEIGKCYKITATEKAGSGVSGRPWGEVKKVEEIKCLEL